MTPDPSSLEEVPFADGDILSMDDEYVKEVLVKLGITTLFSPPPGSGNRMVCATDDRHPTHRFFAVRFLGHKVASDNGYVLFGWRRSQHSFEDVDRYVGEFFKANSVRPTVRFMRGGLS